MQDLDVIARNNAKPAEAHALKTRAATAWNNEPPGRRTVLYSPITNA